VKVFHAIFFYISCLLPLEIQIYEGGTGMHGIKAV